MTLLNVFVVTLICLVGSIQGDNSTKTKIDVYYETLCPDSIRFLLHQLIPNYPIIKSKVNLHLHPFGKAEVSERIRSNSSSKIQPKNSDLRVWKILQLLLSTRPQGMPWKHDPCLCH